MSDGPHRSLSMSRAWQRVAERAANSAFTVNEITDAMIPALRQDCSSVAGLIEDVRTIFEEQQGVLFKTDVRPHLAALMDQAGCGVGRLWLENIVQLSPSGAAELDVLATAFTEALIERAAKGARSVEEHFYRNTSAPRAQNTRARIEQSISHSPIAGLAREILKLESRQPERSNLRQQGLDDGVRL